MNFNSKRNNNEFSHTFVICAYQECIYLEDCILSILNQKLFSSVIMVTSTNNLYIRNLADKYHIKLYVRNGKSDIQKDWNFGYRVAKSDLVTIVHQDDIYDSRYLELVMRYFNSYGDISFVCCNYYPFKNGKKCIDTNCVLKHVLKFFLRFSFFNQFSFFKVGALAFGNSVSCPSVTYNKSKLGSNRLFTSKLKFSLDWDTFLKIARCKGRVFYIGKRLLCYRIHDNATTMKFVINKEKRKEEDYYCFCQIWPKWFANFIMKFYERASDTYDDVRKVS